MPRVHHVKKARKAHPGGIEKGDSYYWWEFRYGGTRYSKTYPRRSQLTQSKMSGVYAGFEGLEDAVNNQDRSEVESALEEYKSAIDEARDEYEDADQQFGGTGSSQHAERAQAMESAYSEVEQFDLDQFEIEDEEDEYGETKIDWDSVDISVIDPDDICQF